MQPSLRPVALGLILGLLSLFFGAVWAVNLTVNHDRIHNRLNESAMSVISGKFVINKNSGHGHAAHTAPSGGAVTGQSHEHGEATAAANDHASHDQGTQAEGHDDHAAAPVDHNAHNPHGAAADASAEQAPARHGHDTDWMAAAHERLSKGHLHAMGLGLLTICVSLLLSMLRSPLKVKTLASACAGIGGFFYPFAWIIMGFRTPALGIEGAQVSVFPIAAFSVLLILAGILLTLFYLILALVRKD